MSYRVVTMYDEGWTKVAVVKTHEDDPSVWGVVGWYATVYVAQRECARMQDERRRLELSEKQIAGYNVTHISGARTARTAGPLTGPTQEVAAMREGTPIRQAGRP